jgi:uncharacterized protein with HEPN domain
MPRWSMPSPDTIRLRPMHEAVTMALQMAAGRSRTELSSDPIPAMAPTRTLEILGEAASRLSDEARTFASRARVDDRRRGPPAPSACS